MKEHSPEKLAIWLAAGFVLAGIIIRLMPHPENVTPLTAIALFGGVWLSRRWAILLPLAAIILSDMVIGLHEVIIFTWGGVALVGLLGWWVRRRKSLGRIALASVLGSCIFFVVTNFGVWLYGSGGMMYAKTLEGLLVCYVAAIPFFRNALLGDLVFTAVFFGLYALAIRALPRMEAAPSARGA